MVYPSFPKKSWGQHSFSDLRQAETRDGTKPQPHQDIPGTSSARPDRKPDSFEYWWSWNKIELCNCDNNFQKLLSDQCLAFTLLTWMGFSVVQATLNMELFIVECRHINSRMSEPRENRQEDIVRQKQTSALTSAIYGFRYRPLLIQPFQQLFNT